MAAGLKSSTLELLKRFNRAFPEFYEQFVSSEIQLQNLRLAYKLYKTRRVVIDIKPEGSKSALHFAYRNQSFLLSDIFGVLAAYGLTIDEAIKAVEGANSNAAAGFYAENGQEYLIQGIGRITTVDDIAEAVVAIKHGQPVLIRHIAEVALGTAPVRGVGSTRGKPAVVLGIQRTAFEAGFREGGQHGLDHRRVGRRGPRSGRSPRSRRGAGRSRR